MSSIASFLSWAAAKSRELLQGETLRFIGYGAIAVVWLVTRIAIWTHLESGSAPSLDAIAAAVTLALAAVTEFARQYVWSPTAAAILEAVIASLKTGVISLPAGLTPAQAADFAARVIAHLPPGAVVDWPTGQPTSTPLALARAAVAPAFRPPAVAPAFRPPAATAPLIAAVVAPDPPVVDVVAPPDPPLADVAPPVPGSAAWYQAKQQAGKG